MVENFFKACNSKFWKKNKVFSLRIFRRKKCSNICKKDTDTREGKFNETERNGGAAEMKRKRRNVDTRAGKKEMHIPRMEFSGNTRRYTMGHQLQ